MNKKRMSFQLPVGMKDLLPGEAGFKRELENTFVRKFIGWGYHEVVTPVLEYYHNLISAETPEEQFFKLIDRYGNILAMRTDMTTPIARMVSSRFSPDSLPLRLFYTANVFRFENPQMGRQREFYQAGVELIGEQSPAADAEVIALAVECLKESGLSGFQISIGQVNFLKGIINDINLDPAAKEKLVRTLTEKDFVGMEMLLERYPVDEKIKNLLLSLPSLRGDSSIIDRAMKMAVNSATGEALENLKEVFELLKVYQVDQEVFVDFGIARDFDYYTGIVFEGYSPGIGFPICGGGRYDHLLGQYGLPAPATGFAIGLERLMVALEERNKVNKTVSIDYLVVSDNWANAVAKAQELRKQGFSVQIAPPKNRELPAVSPLAKSIITV